MLRRRPEYLPPPRELKKVAIVGTGVIGAGWAALFIAKGYKVVAFVRSQGSKDKFMKALEESYYKFVARGIAKDPNGYKAVSCVLNLAECVGDADYVQESVVEDLGTKQHIIQDIDNFAPPHVIIGSSTSFIPLSLLRARAKRRPARVAIAHPSIPQWDAFCEVLGSTPEVTNWLAELYGWGSGSGITGLGMDVVRMKCEQHGHVLNTVTQFNILACTGLVRTGVCDIAAFDVAFTHFCRLGLAAGGIGGLFRLVGGGSSEAAKDLMTDIVIGTPLGKSTAMASSILPGFLLRPAIWIMQVWWWPVQLFKGITKRIVSWLYRPIFEEWDDSVAGICDFNNMTLNQVVALEALAADRKQQLLIKDYGGKTRTRSESNVA